MIKVGDIILYRRRVLSDLLLEVVEINDDGTLRGRGTDYKTYPEYDAAHWYNHLDPNGALLSFEPLPLLTCPLCHEERFLGAVDYICPECRNA